MKINRTTKIAIIFIAMVITFTLFIFWYGDYRAIKDVEEFKKTGKSKYEDQMKKVNESLKINIDYDENKD